MSENPNCALAHAVPVLLTTCPAVLGAKKLTALVPAPTNRLFDVRLVLPVPPLLTVSVPATSAVPRSTAFVVVPEPLKIEAVKVSDTSSSTQSKLKVPLFASSPFSIAVPRVAATVTLSVAAPVVVIPVPASIVAVFPLEIV
ncbi:hypothetical protein ES703_112434 [subsurface metagenome]